jgi:nucleotide-binding universal stress UspA family protein
MDIDDAGKVDENVGLFEAAVHAKPISLPEFRLQSIAAVLDGSNQDATVRAFASAVAKPRSAKVAVTANAKSAAEIVQFARDHKADLLVLPVPFGLDISELRDESLGSVVDMVLLETPCPVFCVRQIMDEPAATAAISEVVLPIGTLAAPFAESVGWAFGLLRSGGQLSIWAVVDQDSIDEARKLLDDDTSPDLWKPEALSRALTDEVGGLIAVAQRRASESSVTVHVEVVCGRPTEIVLPAANRQPSLIVMACERDHSSPAFHLATDMVLGATGPVLVVGSP